ncbi:GNAT family N-acetyltransferase [Acinetobacter rudis]|uniref:GNAT family N-acetyltransferase n=1 Tax=Acinetobacter rudis TaxID=632955 RepID=UPI00333FFAF0
MKLRALTTEDYSQWLVLWSGYQAFYNVSILTTVTETTFSRLLSPDEEMNCLVIEENNQLLGFVHYIFHRSTWTEGNYCYLQDLFINTDVRSKGLGKKLIEAVYAKAEENKCSRVYWLTHENNDQARILYDRVAENAGFIQYRKNLG